MRNLKECEMTAVSGGDDDGGGGIYFTQDGGSVPNPDPGQAPPVGRAPIGPNMPGWPIS